MINDSKYQYVNQIPNNTYHKYCKNIYSQNGEDGLIEKIFEDLKIETGSCCEFGAHNGLMSSNTFNLLKNKNFKSLLIEGDKNLFNQLCNNLKDYSNAIFINQYVTKDNLKDFLNEHNFEKDFDLLSIDIDCDDYYIWENFNEYEPKVVIIEVNSYRDPICKELPNQRTINYIDDPLEKWHVGRIGIGTSFLSMIELGLQKNYIPIAFTGNITFVHKKYIDSVTIPYKISNNPLDYLDLYTNLSLWENTWYTNTGLILNVAIRNYFIKCRNYNLDYNWIVNHINEYKDLIWNFK